MKQVDYTGDYLPIEFSKLNNGYFKAEKSHTGAGGTHGMLSSDIESIIVTPNTSHVEGKEAEREKFESDKKKVLDVRFPKEEQEKNVGLLEKIIEQKYQATIELADGKIRYMYGNDPVELELYAKSIGAKILKTSVVKK